MPPTSPGLSNLSPLDAALAARVHIDSKRVQLAAILEDPQAHHTHRLYAAGFLKFTGFTVDQAHDLMVRFAKWSDLDPAETRRQLESVFGVKTPPAPRAEKTSSSPPPGGASSPPTRWWRVPRTFTGKFSYGAQECWIEQNPQGQRAYYRTVAGNDHTLQVVDLDRPDDLQGAWDAARTLAAHWKPWILRFSGAKGFHCIGKEYSILKPIELKARAQRLVEEAGIEPELVDWCIYSEHRLVRCPASLNLKSGLHAILVRPSWSLNEILERARAPGPANGAAPASGEGGD